MIINSKNENVEDQLIKVYEAARILTYDSSPYVEDNRSNLRCAFCWEIKGDLHLEECEYRKLIEVVNAVELGEE